MCDSTLSGATCRQLSGGGSKSYTSIHSDIRGMWIDAGGDLLTTGDGGIYRRKQPQPAVRRLGDWSPMNGDIVVTECFSGLKSSAFTYCGSQDNGCPNTATPTANWAPTGGDGSVVMHVADVANNKHYVRQALGFSHYGFRFLLPSATQRLRVLSSGILFAYLAVWNRFGEHTSILGDSQELLRIMRDSLRHSTTRHCLRCRAFQSDFTKTTLFRHTTALS